MHKNKLKMREYSKIEIDFDVYIYLQNQRNGFNETENDVLRRILKIDTPQIISENRGESYHTGGVNLQVGLKLRKTYKNVDLEAKVTDRGIMFDNQIFKSPSAAGCVATNTSVNGWIFWEYFDEDSNQWKVLDNLRK